MASSAGLVGASVIESAIRLMFDLVPKHPVLLQKESAAGVHTSTYLVARGRPILSWLNS